MDVEKNGRVKEFYYSLEDKWYALVDSIDKIVPVKPVIRRIDAIFPSFILFTALFLIVFGAAAWFFLFSTPATTAAFKVVGEDNIALSGVNGTIFDGETIVNFTTDEFGEFLLPLNSQTVLVKISHEGFKDFSQELAVIKEVNLIVLEKKAPELEKRFVKIIDEKNRVLNQPSTITFSCSGTADPPKFLTPQTGSEFEVSFLAECSTLTVAVESSGYKKTTKVLSAFRTTIQLEPIEVEAGKIVVQARDAVTNELLPNIDLILFKAKVFPTKANEGKTGASGTYTFNAKPGKYFVKAIDRALKKYASNESEDFEISAGESKNIELLLSKNESVKTKIFLKFVDFDSGQAIEGVKAFLFEEKLFFTDSQSDSAGLLPFKNLNEEKNYSVVLTHPDYVTKIIGPLSLVEAGETQAQEVKLKKANSANSGTVKVVVSSVEPGKNQGIGLAGVSLFVKNYDFAILSGKTDANGAIVFNNMEPADYFALAETATHSGKSGTKTLFSGNEIVLPIDLVIKKSFVIVSTVDGKGKIIEGVNVKFFDSLTGELLDETGTGITGETEKKSFDWTTKFYVVAARDGFIPYHTKIFSLIPQNTLKTKIVLQSVGLNPEFTVKLVQVMDSTKEKTARNFEKGKKYYLKFNLIVPQDGLTEIEGIVRTGFEENMSVVDDNFFITGAVNPNLQTQNIFSSCYDPLNDFAECSASDSDSKQVLLKFGSLNRGVYEFLIEVFVSPKIAAREKLQLRFGARAKQQESALKKPGTGLFFKEFILGDPIFCVRGTANCPNFGFFFTLTDTTGIHLQEPVELSLGKVFDLVQLVEYKLDYIIWNWDENGDSFNNVNLSFTDELDTKAIDISPSFATLGLLEVDTSYQGPPITLLPQNEAASVQIKALLGVNKPDNSALLKFRVLSKNNLEIAVAPLQLNANAVNVLTVTVTDGSTGSPIENATIKVSSENDFSSLIASADIASPGGVYVLSLPPMNAGEKVYVMAEAFNHNPSETVEVKVSSEIVFVPINSSDFDCITIKNTELNLVHKESGNIEIETNSCPRPVEFYLFHPFKGEPLTIENLNDLSIITNSVTPSFTLSENESISIRVNADQLLGEYGIIVRAKFEGEPEFRDIDRVKIIVLPKSAAEGYCFEIDKTTFSINPNDTGKISNKCGAKVVDPFLPNLFMETPDATLNKEHLKIFSEQQFNWSAGLFGTFAESLGGTRTVATRVLAPTSNEGEEINRVDMGAVLSQAFTQACATVTLFSLNCASLFMSHPEIAVILLYVNVTQIMTAELGNENVGLTCSQCKFGKEGETENLFLGTEIESFVIKGIDFDDGGWLKINGQAVSIPGMGPPPPEISEPVGNLLKPQKTVQSTPTGFSLLQLGGFNLQQLMGGGQNPFDVFSQIFNPPQQQQAPAAFVEDSCTGFRIESTNCSGLGTSSGFVDNPLSNAFIGSFCTDIESPIDVKNLVKPQANSYQLFVCNKYNEGFAGVTFEIKDSVDVKMNETSGSLTPVRNEVKELGNISDSLLFNLDNAPKKSYLQLNVSNDSGGKIATWLDESGVKAALIEDSLISGDEIDFKIKNLSIEGEEYTILRVEDYVSEGLEAKLDIVFLVDTSGSMKLEGEKFCEKKSLIESELSSQGINVFSKVFTIGSTSELISCSDETAGWGDTQFTEADIKNDSKEAWGPALQDAISKQSWREGAKRIAVILSDTGPIGTLEETEMAPVEESDSSQQILQNTIDSALKKNVAVSVLFGIPFEKEGRIEALRAIVEQTGGFMKSFEANSGDEKFFANQLLKTVFKTKTENFHVHLVGGGSGVCRGANDQVGFTGKSALPRVMLDWNWDSIGIDTCNLGNEDFVYCDATQLTKQIVKRLVELREKTQNNDFSVGDLLTFKAFLIKDSYSDSFQQDFDAFINEKEFLPLEEYTSNWTKYVSDETKFSFKSDSHSVEPLPATGLYQVNIVLDFPPGKAWKFFEGQEAIAAIKVNLKLEEEVVLANPFYFLPFDAEVGLGADNQSLARNNYGVAFSGKTVKVSQQSGQTQDVETYNTTGTGAAVLDIESKNSFFELNKGDERGVILSVSGTGKDYSMAFSPSIATPILLEIIGENGAAESYFELREGNKTVNLDGYYSVWSGVGSSIGSCNDFSGQNLPFKQPDSTAIDAVCRFGADTSKEASRGFGWSNAPNGRIFLKTVFYTPNANYRIRNSCISDSLIISPKVSSSDGFVNLDFSPEKKILSLKDLFDLVKEKKVCVSETNGATQFWWNESFLERELKKNYEPYFERVLEKNENFLTCSVG